jgi:hypothetical protein
MYFIGFIRNLPAGFLRGQSECVLLELRAVVRAEPALRLAYVRMVDMCVDNVGCTIAVLPSPHCIGYSKDGAQVGRSFKHQAIVEGEPFPRKGFLSHNRKLMVLDVESRRR